MPQALALCPQATTTVVVMTIPATAPISGVLRRRVVLELTTGTSVTIALLWTASATLRAAVIPFAASATDEMSKLFLCYDSSEGKALP